MPVHLSGSLRVVQGIRSQSLPLSSPELYAQARCAGELEILPLHMLHLPSQVPPALSKGPSVCCLHTDLSPLNASVLWRIDGTALRCMCPQLLLH